MKEIYNQIWKLAKPYYLKGRFFDIDHIKWMTKDALLVCKKENLDDSLLIPLVILHDVGYGLGKHVYFEKDSKMEHMFKGKKIAISILNKIGYPQQKIKKIANYISIHDNWIFGKHNLYKNDILLGTFNDLDYIWMATLKGFKSIKKILNKNNQQVLEFLDNNEKIINRPFATKTTKDLYRRYLNDRRIDSKSKI